MRDVHHRTLDVCGLPPRDVMLVQPGHAPQDLVGQAAAGQCREQYLDETLQLA